MGRVVSFCTGFLVFVTNFVGFFDGVEDVKADVDAVVELIRLGL